MAIPMAIYRRTNLAPGYRGICGAYRRGCRPLRRKIGQSPGSRLKKFVSVLSGASILLAACMGNLESRQSPSHSSHAATFPPLLPPPTSCGPSAVAHDLGPWRSAVGDRPVWAAAPAPIVEIPRYVVPDLHGYAAKTVWVVEPGYRELVHLRGKSHGSGQPLWFQLNGQAPTTAPTLDPSLPAVLVKNPAVGEPNYPAFPSYIFFPRSDCYEIEARSSGGSWQLTFSVGSGST
jgi:hypothetical protein